jgi:putative proteasome-type protease
MTFCVGMRVQDGLVGIADTLITSGRECIKAPKLTLYQGKDQCFFLMTSGLRSVRDKALTYFDDAISTKGKKLDRLYKAVNILAEQVRKVAVEDREALVAGGLTFNFHCIIGGQMKNDADHCLYLLYPEGNWVEVSKGTPYQIIGSSTYGKPVIDRTLKFHDSIPYALKVGCLAFDSTRISASDVDFPIDVVLYRKNSFKFVEHRYEKSDLEEITRWWQERLRASIDILPATSLVGVIKEFEKIPAKKRRSAAPGAVVRL